MSRERFGTIVVAATMVLSVVAMGAAGGAGTTVAQQETTVSLEDVEGQNGDVVSVTVSAESATSIAGYDANVTFDESVVQVDAVSGDAFGDPITNINNQDGYIVMTQSSAQGQGTDLDLVTIDFEIVGNQGDASDLSFVQVDTSLNDEGGNTITIDNYQSGSVTVPSLEPNVVIETVDPETAVVDAGESQSWDVTVNNTGTEAGTQDVVVDVDGAGQDTASVTLAPGDAPQTVSLSPDGIDQLEPGEYDVTVSTDDDQFDGTLTVSDPSEGPPPVVGDDPPQDIDGDGVYEDVDGDEDFDITDVQILFLNLEGEVVQNHVAAFDFDGDETITITDVQVMFYEYRDR